MTVRSRPKHGGTAICRDHAPPIRDPLTGQPFAGNQIPRADQPNGRAILYNTTLYPLPNRTVSGVIGNYVGETLTTIRAHQGDGRIDWNASANDNIFGRVSFADLHEATTSAAVPALLGPLTTRPFRNVAVNWNHVVNSSRVNEVLVGYNQITFVRRLSTGPASATPTPRSGLLAGSRSPDSARSSWAAR